jgi:hypothetical protein
MHAVILAFRQRSIGMIDAYMSLKILISLLGVFLYINTAMDTVTEPSNTS